MPSVYEPLAQYLRRRKTDTVTLSFERVERIIGRDLPASARNHEAWWANAESHSQAVGGWLAAGFKVNGFDIGSETVRFRRREPDSDIPVAPSARSNGARARCRNCKFSNEVVNSHDLECRRNPPSFAREVFRMGRSVAQTTIEATWPTVRSEDWCGEFVEQS